ncbi:TAP-like protein-domain-containing protein [Cladochytrium replicatum]|nr:TAP-like protein-domain-containing protein [Cladochytrium replicatum]
MPTESSPLLSTDGASAAVHSAFQTVKDFSSRPDVRRFALVAALLLIGLSPFTFYKTASPPPQKLPFPGKFDWKPCGPDGLVCSKFVVPLDHLNSSDSRYIPLAVIRIPATTKPSLGPLFLNPGGPGGSGLAIVRKRGKFIQEIVGGRYDIVSWDPRGVGESEPIKCFANAYQQQLYNEFGGASGRPVPKDADPLRQFTAYAELLGKQCQKYTGDYLKYMSTASVARDLDAMREAFGQELTNYWGFSYGTFLGATYVNMFGDRVGRVILDGVTDPTTYSGDKIDWTYSSLVHADEVVDGLGLECEKAGPLRCPLAKPTSTDFKPGYVSRALKSTFEKLRADPIVYSDEDGSAVITGDDFAQVLFQMTYAPSTWPALVPALADIVHDGNASRLAAVGSVAGDSCPVKLDTPEAHYGIMCTDTENRPEHSTREGFLKGVEESSSASWLAGFGWAISGYHCVIWPVKAVERFAGPWNNPTRNKVLLIANTLDPVTPIESAQKLEELMEGNGVLFTQIGYGHCSLAQPSKCTNEVIYNYLVNGVVPEPGTKCDVDGSPFPEVSAAFAKKAEKVDLTPDFGFPFRRTTFRKF